MHKNHHQVNASNIEAITKWLPLCREHFQINFLVWKLFYSYMTDICFKWSNRQYVTFGSDDGLVSNWHYLNWGWLCLLTHRSDTCSHWVNMLNLESKIYDKNQQCIFLLCLRYSIPNTLVYHSKNAFQILWKKIKVCISFSKHHKIITCYPNYIFWQV